MAIQIIFYRSIVISRTEHALEKLRACYDAIQFFKDGLFTPKTIEVWYDARSQALGGKRVKNIKISNLYENISTIYQFYKNLSILDLKRTITVFTGNWSFDNIELGGYFSVQNQEDWRKTYGDITISAYAKNGYVDLTDALWSLPEIREIILRFTKVFSIATKKLNIKLSQMSFSIGAYSNEDPTNLLALYLSGTRKNLLKIFYRALLKSGEKRILFKSKPLDTNFLIDILLNKAIVTERIDKRLEQDLVNEIPTQSVLYFGKYRDSFKKLFHDISEAVIIPAFNKLPEASVVEYQIEEGLNEFKDSNNKEELD